MILNEGSRNKQKVTGRPGPVHNAEDSAENSPEYYVQGIFILVVEGLCPLRLLFHTVPGALQSGVCKEGQDM